MNYSILIMLGLSGCVGTPKDIGDCWSGKELQKNMNIKGRVIIRSSDFSAETMYPERCDGVGVNIDLPYNFDLKSNSKNGLSKSWKGGYFFLADIKGKTSENLVNGRVEVNIKTIENVTSLDMPIWMKLNNSLIPEK